MRRIFCSLELGSSPAVRAVIAAVQSMAAILGGGIGVDELAEVVAVQLGSVGDEHSDGGLCGVDASGAKRCGQGGGLR